MIQSCYCSIAIHSRRNFSYSVPIVPTPEERAHQVTGLCDRSGSFGLRMYAYGTAWRPSVMFELLVPIAHKVVVEELANFFGVGKVFYRGTNAVFRVQDLAGVLVIIEHFQKYPLVTTKATDFALWSEAVKLLSAQVHRGKGTESDFLRLMSISAALGRGPSKDVQAAYPNLVPAEHGHYDAPVSLNHWWVSGYLTVYSSFSAWVSYNVYLKAYGWKHSFSTTFSTANLAVAQLMAELFECSLIKRSDGIRIDVIAQGDWACYGVYEFLLEFPLCGPKMELVELWADYVEDTIDTWTDVRRFAYRSGGRLLDHGRLSEKVRDIQALNKKLGGE